MRNLMFGRRWRAAAFGLLVLAVGGAGLFAGDGPVAQAATTYKAFVGGGEASPAGGIAVEAFRPDQIRIHPGDTIQWTNPYEEIHTVTFVPATQPRPALIVNGDFNPMVAAPTQQTAFDANRYTNSGILGKGQGFSLTFPNQGAFQFYCVIHPGMIVNVFVVPDSVQVESQSQLDARAAEMLTQGVAAGRGSVAGTQAAANEVTNPASVGLVDLMYFVPQRINIPVGGTVTWRNRTAVPHTVTFNIQSAPSNFVAALPTVPSGGFSGAGFANSGFFGVGPESVVGETFSLRFTQAGTYNYICLLHADQGMVGTVVVGTGTGTVSPPSTGDGGLLDSEGSSWWAVYAGALLLGVAGVAGLVVGRRLAA